MKILFLLFIIAISTDAECKSFTFKSGPVGVGLGGSNPGGIPPGPGDVELTWVTDGGIETNINIFPGIGVGYRFSEPNYYVSTGGGLVLGVNGIGVGGYAAFGWVTGKEKKGWHWTIEYKQTVGISSETTLLSPGALRAGIIWEW